MECSFDNSNFCLFQNTTDYGKRYYWTTGRKTPSFNTGPSKPFNNKGIIQKRNNFKITKILFVGLFAYAEASYCAKGTTTNLTSPFFYSNSLNCLSFYYNLYGDHIGSLIVYLTNIQQMSNELVLNGTNRNKDEWVKHEIKIKNDGLYKVITE